VGTRERHHEGVAQGIAHLVVGQYAEVARQRRTKRKC
jgi:hypothetical protein